MLEVDGNVPQCTIAGDVSGSEALVSDIKIARIQWLKYKSEDPGTLRKKFGALL